MSYHTFESARARCTRFARGAVLAFAALACLTEAATGSPVAMMTDVTGEVTVMRGEQSRSAEILDSVTVGERLVLADGAAVTLVYMDQNAEHVLEGPGSARIAEDGPKPDRTTRASTNALQGHEDAPVNHEAVSRYRQAALVFRSGNRARDVIQLLSPVNTALLDARPVFTWRTPEPVKRVRFELVGDSGEIVHSADLSGSRLELPADVSLREDADYSWHVVALENRALSSGYADVYLLEAEKRRAIERMRPGAAASVSQRVLYAIAMENAGLTQQAGNVWRRLAEERPDQQGLRKLAGE